MSCNATPARAAKYLDIIDRHRVLKMQLPLRIVEACLKTCGRNGLTRSFSSWQKEHRWQEWADKVLPIMRKMEVLKIDNTEAKVKGKMVPIWKKYMLTVDEAVLYFGIGEKKIRMLISENVDSDYCFTVQVGNKSLINRHKFEEFLNQTTSL